MVIDANLYWLPEELFDDQALAERFLADAEKSGGMSGRLRTDNAGRREILMENPPGFANLNYRAGDYVLERQLADMDAAGVDRAVLKLPGCQEWMSLDLCRRFNDGVAAHARRSGGRLIPLACVPPRADADCLAELRRCREELGMSGVQLSAHYGADYLDSPRFTAFFEHLDAQPTTVYIHHAPTPVDDASLLDYTNLRRSYGRCVDQATAVGREVFSGFFDRHPRLTFVHSMLGGAFFALLDLLLPPHAPETADGRFDPAAGGLRGTFTEHVYFELSHAQPWGAAQLECAVRVLGADHVVYGSSYPVKREWMTGGPAFVRALGLSEADQDLVLGQNAARLYALDGVAGYVPVDARAAVGS